MNTPLSHDWRERAARAAKAMRTVPALMERVRAEVRAILATHSDLPDDELTRECLTVLAWEQLSKAAGAATTPDEKAA